MKTVLAPNAPWPKWEEKEAKPPAKPKPKPKPKPKKPSKMKHTDAKFAEWAEKNLAKEIT
jgi:hypothetical protein